MPERLFVYGTLLSSFFCPESIRMRQENILLGPAHVKGTLYRIGGYPGAVYDPYSGRKIQGELYQIVDPGKTFRWLDRYETADLHLNPGCEYHRIRVPVHHHNGILNAWIYQYAKSNQGFPRILTGNYLTSL
jgi:gamma-glutamylcyclotransferase (GGCT)/AIG2-like uncharacterized protein YtfP